jgi:hypothetical protein
MGGRGRHPRRVAAVVGALVVATVLAGCGPQPKPALTAGLLNVLARSCIDSVGVRPGTVLTILPSGWTLTTPGASVGGGARGTRTGGDPESADGRVATRFAACMNATEVDYSLTLADGVAQRMAIYGWYKTALYPCLRRHGIEPPPLANAEVFYAEPYGDTDPYVFAPLRDVKAALDIQRACPPAPPGVAISAIATTRTRP